MISNLAPHNRPEYPTNARQAMTAKEAQEQLELPAAVNLAQPSALSQQECKSLSDARNNTTIAEQHAPVPVDGLYPDILAIIFTYLRDTDPPDRIHRTYDTYRRRAIPPGSDWITVTYVCRRWRQVALERATLWTDIDPTALGRKWAAAFIARSQRAPISIQNRDREPLNPSSCDWVVRLLDENMWRTQSLKIVAYQDGALATINNHAPLLHTLDITAVLHGRVPHTFLGGCAPALRHCRFKASLAPGMSWASPLFSSLTSLDMHDRSQPVHDLLDALEHLPELESMSARICPRSQPLLPGRRGVVTPARLVELKINDVSPDAPRLTYFLSHLSLATHCLVRCQMWAPIVADFPANYLDEVYAFTLASVHAHANSAIGINNAITNLSIDTMNTQYYHPTSTVIINPRRHGETTPHVIFEFEQAFQDHSLWDVNIVPKALKTFSSAHLQELTIWTPPMYVLDTHAWADLMGRAPGLRRLTVRTAKAVVSLCTAMLLVDASPPHVPRIPAPRLQCIFPALATLVLTEARLGVDIVAGGRGGDAPEDNEKWLTKVGANDERGVAEEGDDERVSHELPLCLIARAQSGYPLEELDVAQCDVDEAWVAQVREALPGMRVTHGTRPRKMEVARTARK
ncbi:hypothetical protein FA95DRAFT_1608493 [Auriscalpium vulgare]|uniref:Uncharacterized protein n=1 Tax=Auriscalpium vulgare TaxID=40419 RepID=A0ACB8RKT9_9AGAM|nr:hypothetical protein FA95DRAFT_1608493 [Auriscalpium vulgare]